MIKVVSINGKELDSKPRLTLGFSLRFYFFNIESAPRPSEAMMIIPREPGSNTLAEGRWVRRLFLMAGRLIRGWNSESQEPIRTKSSMESTRSLWLERVESQFENARLGLATPVQVS